MNQLRLEETVRQVLTKCRERADSSITRELIHSALNNNAQESLDVLSILVRELWVFVLHNESDVVAADSAQSTPNVKTKDSPSDKKSSPNMDAKTSSDGKQSLLGSIPLPSRHEFEEFSEQGSASDVPSHSSASSEDEENSDKYTEELWKKTLSNQDPNYQTHRNFFETLVKDVEGEHQGLDPNEKQNTNVDEFDTFDDDLALDEKIFVAVSSSLALAEQTERERNLQDGEEDADVVISSAMISDIGMNTALHMELEGLQAVRCGEDIEDCLCFLYGQPLTSENKNYLIQTIQKLMLDRAEHLQVGQWYNPAEEDDDDDTFDGINQITEQLAIEESASTPEKSLNRSKVYEESNTTATAEEFLKSTSKAAALVHQTPARTPYHMVTPGKSTGSKRPKINYDQLDPDLPAWMIPKSPLDSIFRTGYGGIGQSQLKEVIALVEEDSEDDENSDSDEHVDHMRLHHTSMDQISLADGDSSHDEHHDAIDLDDLPADFGKDQVHVHQGRVVARNSMTKSHQELSELHEEVPRPEDHPSTSVPHDQGKMKLTKSAALNAMIVDSYKGLISQYAAHPKHSQHVPIMHHHHHDGAHHYDYDETTVGTSMDSEGYKRMLKQAKRAAAPAAPMHKSPSASPKKKATSPAVSPKNPTHSADLKAKKPVVTAVIKTKQTSRDRVAAADTTESKLLLHSSFEGDDANLMLESPATSISLPKKAKKEGKTSSKKKRASTGSHTATQTAVSKSTTSLHMQENHVVDETKKKRPSSAKKMVRASSGSRLLEPTEAMKSRADNKQPMTGNMGGRWKS